MVTGPSEETSKPSVFLPRASPSAAENSACDGSQERFKQRTIVNSNSVDHDARSSDGNATSGRILNDSVLEGTAVIDAQERSGLRLAAASAVAILDERRLG